MAVKTMYGRAIGDMERKGVVRRTGPMSVMGKAKAQPKTVVKTRKRKAIAK